MRNPEGTSKVFRTDPIAQMVLLGSNSYAILTPYAMSLDS